MISQSTTGSATTRVSPAETDTQVVPAVSNSDLECRVRLFLNGSNLPGLRHIDLEAQGDTVVLRGTAWTFYEKQLASRLARRVAGVIHVVDLIEVREYVPLVEPSRAHRRVSQNLAHPA
jgi:osmotically-inducible protein OsmY